MDMPPQARRYRSLVWLAVFGCVMLFSLHAELHGWREWASAIVVFLLVALAATSLIKLASLALSALKRSR